MRRYTLLLCIISLVFISASCNNPNPDNTGTTIETIFWENDGNGFRQFYTNDEQYYNSDFTSILTLPDKPMTTVEMNVKKISGYSSNDFGILFCFQDIINFYRLLITTNGNYIVIKKEGGTDSTLIPWTSDSELNTGYNTINNLKVSYAGSNNFNIFFNVNVTADATFNDGSFTSGRSGYYAHVGNSASESFPDTPVDIRIQRIQPVTDP